MKVTIFPKGGRGYEDVLIEQVNDVRFLHFSEWPRVAQLGQCSRVLILNPDEVVAVILEDDGDSYVLGDEVTTAATATAAPETPTSHIAVNVAVVPELSVFTRTN